MMKKVLKIVDLVAEKIAKNKVAAVAISAAVAGLVGWAVDPAVVMIVAEVVASLI